MQKQTCMRPVKVHADHHTAQTSTQNLPLKNLAMCSGLRLTKRMTNLEVGSPEKILIRDWH
jgi:hypothetical protein